jgi:hypothetical protein
LTNAIVAVFFLMLTCIIYYYYSKDIELKLAWRGASPHNYVAEKLYPDNFSKNWEAAGVGKYDFSLPMKVYYYLAKYFGISPSTTIHPFMFIQTLLFLLSVAFLSQTLFQNRLVTIISVVIIPLSNLAGINLSRFGDGYGTYLSYPLFYAYSNAFRIFALGFFLKNKYILMFIFLALSIYCHVNMGFFALAFIGGYFLYRPGLFRDKTVLIGITVFLALVVPHIYSILTNSAATTSGSIPVDQWVKSTKIFSFHWYPITMKLFARYAHSLFFPLLLLCFFFFVALRYQNIKDEKNVKILLGTIVCMILSVLGIIFSDIYPIPFLIKISLQRSTGLITFLGVLYIIYYLFRKIDNGKTFHIFLAIYSLFLLVFAKPGIAVLPLFLLLYSDIKEGHFGSLKIEAYKTSIRKSFYFIMAFLLLMLTLTCIFQNNHKIVNNMFGYLWTPLQFFNPFHSFDFLLKGGVFKIIPFLSYLVVGSFLITLTINYFDKSGRNKTSKIFFSSLFFLISLSTVWYLERDKYLNWHHQYSEIASSYLDVQLWAKSNTPSDSLFMPDPSHYYGWRDFSERSSFGNLREWGYTSIAYNPDQKVFEEGLRRMKELGVDISKVTMDDINKFTTVPYFYKFDNVRKNYNNMSDSQLQKLSSENEIDYFIFNKSHLQKSLPKLFKKFRIAYSNDNFYVLQMESKN